MLQICSSARKTVIGVQLCQGREKDKSLYNVYLWLVRPEYWQAHKPIHKPCSIFLTSAVRLRGMFIQGRETV